VLSVLCGVHLGETPASTLGAGIEKKGGDSRWLSPPHSRRLMTETQIRNELPIPLQILSLQVFQEAATAPHELEKAAATVVILLVPVEVIPQLVDAGCQESDLHGCAASVCLVELVLLDDLFAVNGHLARASTGAYAAGEAPPLMLVVNVSA
jgi:hypothetical protein